MYLSFSFERLFAGFGQLLFTDFFFFFFSFVFSQDQGLKHATLKELTSTNDKEMAG